MDDADSWDGRADLRRGERWAGDGVPGRGPPAADRPLVDGEERWDRDPARAVADAGAPRRDGRVAPLDGRPPGPGPRAVRHGGRGPMVRARRASSADARPSGRFQLDSISAAAV